MRANPTLPLNFSLFLIVEHVHSATKALSLGVSCRSLRDTCSGKPKPSSEGYSSRDAWACGPRCRAAVWGRVLARVTCLTLRVTVFLVPLYGKLSLGGLVKALALSLILSKYTRVCKRTRLHGGVCVQSTLGTPRKQQTVW